MRFSSVSSFVSLKHFTSVLVLLLIFFSQATLADTVYTEDFETGGVDWTISNGVWEIGFPSTGPAGCGNGSSQCAGTVLAGYYPPDDDSRLISPSISLPALPANEEVHLRFQQWFSYNLSDAGYVQVSVWDANTATWGAWENVGTAAAHTSSWSQQNIDLTAYAGTTVRLGFYHTAVNNSGYGTGTDVDNGWFIDDIVIEATTATNHPPSLPLFSNVSVNENDTLIIPLTATDPNLADTLFFTVTAPEFISLTDNGDWTGELVASPDFTDAGDHLITVTVTDLGGLSDSQQFTLTVNDQSRAPTLAPISNQTMNEGQTLVVPLSSTDPDVGDTLTLSVSGPAFVTLMDNGDGTGQLSIEPGFDDAGAYSNVTVTVTDSAGLSSDRVFALTVNDVPPPAITSSVTDLDFGDVLTGDTASLSFTISNDGGSPLVVSSISSSSDSFTVLAPTNFTVEPNGFLRAVSVAFSPTGVQGYLGSLTISHNAGNDIVINLSGNGVSASGLFGNIDVVDSVEFGTVFNTADSTQEIVVNNNGEGLLAINNVLVDNAKFSVEPQAGE